MPSIYPIAQGGEQAGKTGLAQNRREAETKEVLGLIGASQAPGLIGTSGIIPEPRTKWGRRQKAAVKDPQALGGLGKR